MGKKILFLHPNFPGQFKHLCCELAKNHEVVFLCQTHYNRKVKNVRRLTMKVVLSSEELESRKLDHFSRTQLIATQYRRAMEKLKNEGWLPEIVISHSGWGAGLHTRDLAKHTYSFLCRMVV